MSTFLLILTLVITLANSFFIWWIYRHLHKVTTGFHKKLTEFNMEHELNEAFSHDTIDGEDIHKLAFDLFKRVKQLYSIKAHSYSEMAAQLKARGDIQNNLRDAMVDFFQNIIHISYRQHSLSEVDREDIKKKIKMILTMLPPE